MCQAFPFFYQRCVRPGFPSSYHLCAQAFALPASDVPRVSSLPTSDVPKFFPFLPTRCSGFSSPDEQCSKIVLFLPATCPVFLFLPKICPGFTPFYQRRVHFYSLPTSNEPRFSLLLPVICPGFPSSYQLCAHVFPLPNSDVPMFSLSYQWCAQDFPLPTSNVSALVPVTCPGFSLPTSDMPRFFLFLPAMFPGFFSS